VGDDVIVDRYVNTTVKSRTSELAAALDATGVEYSVVGVEGENAARTVLGAAKNDDVDILCVGTHGLGRFEGLLGSTSTKLARRAPCSVMLVR
jgi:nucleotide-binding universal stress UspA family protein